MTESDGPPIAKGSATVSASAIGASAALAVIARLDRAIQHSRDGCDWAERPRRTGFPACRLR